MQKDTYVSDIYWYEIIKSILSKSKQYLFTVEIWEKMKDNYGYSYSRDRVEKELLDLQRTGYAIPISKRGEQAWTFPSGKKLITLDRTKKIDWVIAEFVEESDRLPEVENIINKLNEPAKRQEISDRLEKISKLTDSIDGIIKKKCEEMTEGIKGNENQSQEIEPKCETDKKDTSFYESLVKDLDGTIEDIDILAIIKIIDARKKLFT